MAIFKSSLTAFLGMILLSSSVWGQTDLTLATCDTTDATADRGESYTTCKSKNAFPNFSYGDRLV